MADPAAVTAADIARLAGVTRGTVSNWRRRHADFPAPYGGTDANPAYNRAEVEGWLSSRGILPELSRDEVLWRAITREAGEVPLHELMMRATRELAETDETSATMDSLFVRYADSMGKPATPPPVAELMAALALPNRQEVTVFDPAAGTGELLAATFGGQESDAFGQELDSGLAELAGLRLDIFAAEGPYSATVMAGDSLRDDRFPALRADAVLCHPPFADREWGAEELAHDPRWVYGTPPKSEPELAWVQHCLAHLVPGGIAALLLPPAVASRASGRRIRAELLRRGALRAVIALPPGAVRPRHVPVHLWLLTRPADRAPLDPRVLLVDGASLANRETGKDGGGTSAGWDGFRALTLRAWQAFTEDSTPDTSALAGAEAPGGWRIVRAIDLLDESVDVSPARHVAPPPAATSPAWARDEARILSAELRTALAVAQAAIPDGEWPPSDHGQTWRVMTVEDLVGAGMAEFYRASSKRQEIPLRSGDVIVSPMAGAVVVTDESLGAQDSDEAVVTHAHLIRPLPKLLDPWFLAGFLAAPANVKQASYGSGATRIDARRLTVPLLPIDQQRAYAAVFRQLHELAAAVTRVSDLATELAGLLAGSLAEGTLLPPDLASRDTDETSDGVNQ